eukprot:TRINITY_DN8425_c0_g1_i1.p2 TRINITY_DN8425_c0_g1~~TRINITY_DN8425_c0_g1_i1.p2  ORF type:complete len:193 (-),score=43.46 TRINITY_DN8425_c0_g1_i1:142-720(-)
MAQLAGLALSAEAMFPALAAGAGIVAAVAFIASGSSEGEVPGMKADPEPLGSLELTAEDRGRLADSLGMNDLSNASGSAPTARDKLEQRRKNLTPEQEQAAREKFRNLSPESQKSIREWLDMCEQDKWAIVAMNTLAILLVVALVLCVVGYIIAVHKVNPFELKFWKSAQLALHSVMNGFNHHLESGHSAEL